MKMQWMYDWVPRLSFYFKQLFYFIINPVFLLYSYKLILNVTLDNFLVVWLINTCVVVV